MASSPSTLAESDKESPKRRSNMRSVFVVVVLAAAIIGVLVWLAVDWLVGAKEKGKWAMAQNDINELARALNDYAAANGGKYPTSLHVVAPAFGGSLPKDPYTDNDFTYELTPTGFRLTCLGKDQRPGGADIPDRDIIFD